MVTGFLSHASVYPRVSWMCSGGFDGLRDRMFLLGTEGFPILKGSPKVSTKGVLL